MSAATLHTKMRRLAERDGVALVVLRAVVCNFCWLGDHRHCDSRPAVACKCSSLFRENRHPRSKRAPGGAS